MKTQIWLTKNNIQRIIELMEKFDCDSVRVEEENTSGIGSNINAIMDVILMNEHVTVTAVVSDERNW